MKKLLTLTAGFMIASNMGYAAGSHSSGHGHDAGDDHATMAVGEPGKPGKVSRNVSVNMKETDGGEMVFEPRSFDVRQGETIRFRIVNKGELEHEFVLDEHAAVMEHKAVMEKFPEMEHDDPNSIRLEPGKRGEVIWKFSNSGNFEFACLIPGHYEAGMKGELTVTESQAKN